MAALGGLYSNGQGVPQNYKRAFELLQQSRALGNTSPELHFGAMPDARVGCARSIESTVEPAALCT